MSEDAHRKVERAGEQEPASATAGRAASPLPIIYSCSGCSSAAQLANHIALRLDRLGVAEMSCIAGVGGDVPSLVRVATSGRPIVALDGCPLHCVRSCLARHGQVAALHVTLSEHGVKRRIHEDFDQDTADALVDRFVYEVKRRFGGAEP